MKLRLTKQRLLKVLKWSGITVVFLFVLFLILNILLPLPDDVEYSTLITDNKGELINAYLTKDEKWRMKTELNEISPLLSKTIIAKEDKYFYSHPGINPAAICKSGCQKHISIKTYLRRQHHNHAGSKGIGAR
jgi:penicillin-binding protein 1C